jgi:peptide/nickel transport system permease protein
MTSLGEHTRRATVTDRIALPSGSWLLPSKRVFAVFRRSPLTLFGLCIVVGLVAFSLGGHFFLPDPLAIHPAERLLGPSLEAHPFGTDNLGRDLLSRVATGTRTTLAIAVSSVALAALWGVPLGVVAGYLRGWVDGVTMRLLDILFAFPALLLALAVIAVLGPSVPNLILTIGLVYTAHFARIARGPVLSVREQDFVQAARIVGARGSRIMAFHILPNVLAPIIVSTTVSLSTAILLEAGLSFLGLGTQPPTPSLGVMISASRAYMETAPWLAVFPGIVIALLVAGINLVGDGLRDSLDTRRSATQ